MDRLAQSVLMGAAGAAGAEPLYVEEVFSTYLYEGTSSTQTITNGIDLAGEGGLVWMKHRSGTYQSQTTFNHHLNDTERTSFKYLSTSTTNQELGDSYAGVNAYNSDGFTLAGSFEGPYNAVNCQYTSWTFRKAEKFFDVVTWTGDGATSRFIDHSLDAIPGCIIVKKTNTTSDWYVWHRSGTNTTGRYCALLNSTATYTDQGLGNVFGTGSLPYTPTSTQIRVASALNVSGETYVAYLFAHDAGGFGDDGTESVIKCGSFTGTGFVNLGWEPQWILIKPYTQTHNWEVYDNMRGMGLPAGSGAGNALKPNLADAEGAVSGISFEATGFTQTTFGATYPCIYIAIRRGPMKTPTDATEVFAMEDPGSPLNSDGLAFSSGWPVDWAWLKERTNTDPHRVLSRITGNGRYLETINTNAESSGIFYGTFDHSTGWFSTSNASMSWMFRRAPGFFDVVAYAGNGAFPGTVSHNLGVTPEMIIVKVRNTTGRWAVYHVDLSASNVQNAMRLNEDTAVNTNNNFTAGNTSTTFEVQGTAVNNGSDTFIAYLFASCPGVSKVGSYTGTGTTLDVNCGFTAGARFVMIKRTDTQITGQTPPTGYDTDWYIWDTTRGIVSGNDPYLTLNETDDENTGTNFIDPLSTGFQITSSAPAAINALNGTFIYLAIA